MLNTVMMDGFLKLTHTLQTHCLHILTGLRVPWTKPLNLLTYKITPLAK